MLSQKKRILKKFTNYLHLLSYITLISLISFISLSISRVFQLIYLGRSLTLTLTYVKESTQADIGNHTKAKQSCKFIGFSEFDKNAQSYIFILQIQKHIRQIIQTQFTKSISSQIDIRIQDQASQMTPVVKKKQKTKNKHTHKKTKNKTKKTHLPMQETEGCRFNPGSVRSP